MLERDEGYLYMLNLTQHPMRHHEKRHHLLKKLGGHLKSQRETLFREDHTQFALRLGIFGAVNATAELVDAMENGSEEPGIGLWICAWQAMQVADAVVAASKSDGALFLAATQYAAGIEAEMIAELNKISNRKDAS